MKSHLTFNFSARAVNDQYMSMLNLDSPESIQVLDQFTVSMEVELPFTLWFELSGKISNDTVVENGTIVADKFIKLESIQLDKFDLEVWRIPNKYLFLTADGQDCPTNYWGKNGTANFIIDNQDPAFWLLECPDLYS